MRRNDGLNSLRLAVLCMSALVFWVTAVAFATVRVVDDTAPGTPTAPAATTGPEPSTPAPTTPTPTTTVSVHYSSCKQARDSGHAPLHPGDPGYRPELDRDHDGTACDTTP